MAFKTAYELGETTVTGTDQRARVYKLRTNCSVNEVARELHVKLLGRRDNPTEHTIVAVISDGAGHEYYGVAP